MNKGQKLVDVRPAIGELIRIEQGLRELALKFNLNLKASGPALYKHLETQTPERIATINKNLDMIRKCLVTAEEQGVNPWDDKLFLTLSMRVAGLVFPPDFLNNSTSEDLIEGYDKDRIQIFRNLRFMETSAYSLSEIQAYEWPVLFDRSSIITDQLISYTDDLLWQDNKTVELDIPEHFIREVCTQDPQMLSVTFRHMAPLFTGPNQPYGLLVSCRARIIAKEEPATRLAFL